MTVGRVIWYENDLERSLLYPMVSDTMAVIEESRMVSEWWVRVKYERRMAAVSTLGGMGM